MTEKTELKKQNGEYMKASVQWEDLYPPTLTQTVTF